ncbi:hypothetical protein CC86DRAFT_380262 [Ophiobolus disseminans]|uniref:Uncharacterized protein n=1 Tax=Ophiobolus disseminans TaxID=1469910 RepID=A0A6A7AA92_9PLEO|nr:hypothetical protein CC86DRAFT_380262 [Ophiobolus disseminans]
MSGLPSDEELAHNKPAEYPIRFVTAERKLSMEHEQRIGPMYPTSAPIADGNFWIISCSEAQARNSRGELLVADIDVQVMSCTTIRYTMEEACKRGYTVQAYTIGDSPDTACDLFRQFEQQLEATPDMFGMPVRSALGWFSNNR